MKKLYSSLLTLLLVFTQLAANATHYSVSTLNGNAVGSLTWALTQVNNDNTATISNPHVIDICVGSTAPVNLSPLPVYSCVINCPKDMSLTLTGIYYNIGTSLSGIRVTINNAVFTGNSGAAFGSAFMGGSGACYVFNHCLFSNNNAQYQAGALFLNGDSAFLYGCTFYNNTTTNAGGAGGAAVYNNHGYVSLNNCTFSSNSSVATPSYAGGGAVLNDGNMDLVNCTFYNNYSANNGGGLCHRTGGGFCNITNCIFTGNNAGSAGANVWGVFVSPAGHNLFQDTLSAQIGGTVTGNIYGATSTLVLDTVLRNNGHYMLTHALVAASAAIDAGTSAGAPALDAREYTRTGATDIGAFEYLGNNPCVGFTTQINPLASSCLQTNTWSSTTTGGATIEGANWFDGTNYSCGDTLTYTGNGTFTFTVTDSDNCVAKDSITFSFHLPAGSITVSTCQDSGYTLGSHTYTTSGTYIDTLQGVAMNGCDSVVTINLTLYPPASALHFKGANDFSGFGGSNQNAAVYNYVSIPDNADLRLGNTYTIETWINLDDSVNNAIIDKGNYNYLFETHPNGHTGLGLINNAMGWKYSSGTIPTHQWVHVAVTFDAVNDEVVFYMNGNVLSTHNGVTAAATDTGIATIGMQSPSMCSCNNFDGKMDELRIWNRVLCQTEIQNTMNCELDAAGQTGLVALYHFNRGCIGVDNSGETTLADASGNGHTGTLINFALSADTSNWSSGIVSGNTCAAPLVQSVSVFANQSHICANATTYFTATPVNAGTPVYQWYQNGIAAGTDSNIYSPVSLSNGDQVWVVMGNSFNCDSVTSNTVTIVVSATDTTNITTGICHGDSYTVGTHTYTTSGTYTDTLQNVTGCDSIVILHLRVSTLATNISATVSTLNCTDTSSVITVTGGVSYVWSNGATTASIKVTLPATYYVTVTDSVGNCTATNSFQIGQNLPPVHVHTHTLCGNETVTVGTDTYDTTGVYTYRYGCDSVVISYVTKAPAIQLPAVTLTGLVCNTDTIGSAHFTTANYLAITIDTSTQLLMGDTSWADTVYSYSTQYSSTGWSATQILGAPNTYPGYGDIATNWTPETYGSHRDFIEVGYATPVAAKKVLVYETDAPGYVDTVYVRQYPSGTWQTVYTGTAVALPSVATILNVTLDSVTTIDAVRLAIATDVANNWVELDAVGLLTAGGGAASFNVRPDSTYALTLTNDYGCSISDTVTIPVAPVRLLVSASSDTICRGNQATLAAVGSASYIWSNSATTATIIASPASTSAYSVTATDSLGCVAHTDITITVDTATPVTITPALDTICNGNSATLNATGASSYVWSNNAHTDNITVQPTADATYTVSGTDANGCVATQTASVIVKVCDGIEATEQDYNIHIFPNPASTQLNISSDTRLESVEVFNLLGQVVIKQQGDVKTIDVTNLAAGMYTIRMGITSEKYVVTRFCRQ